MTIVFPFYFCTGFICASTYRTIKIYIYIYPCVCVYVYYILLVLLLLSIGLYAHVTVYTYCAHGVKQIEVLVPRRGGHWSALLRRSIARVPYTNNNCAIVPDLCPSVVRTRHEAPFTQCP